MLDYLKKFNNLPQDLRDKFAAPEILANVSEIEKTYNVSLATVIMRVLIKDIALVDLVKFMVFEFSMDARRAENLVNELNDKVFSVAADYLGLNQDKPIDILEKVDADDDQAMSLAREKMAIRTSSFFFSADDEREIQELTRKVAAHKESENERLSNLEPQMRFQQQPQSMEKKMSDVMKKVNVSFSSDDLNSRFRNIVETYLRGVRNRIDIRQAMIKDVAIGGLGLSEEAINDVITKIDEVKKSYEEPLLVPPLVNSRFLERDGIKPEVGARDAEYDFSKLKQDKFDKEAVAEAVADEKKEQAVAAVSAEETNVASKEKEGMAIGTGQGGVNVPAEQIIQKEQIENQPPRIKSTFKNFAFVSDPVAPDTMMKEERIVQPKFDQSTSYADDGIKKMAIDAKSDLLRSIGERARKINVNNNKMAATVEEKKVETDSVEKVQPIMQIQEEKKVEVNRVLPIQPIVQTQVENKKRMDDVKYVPNLIGPVEELRIMNLVNFRRLSQVPKDAKGVIMTKINFLEGESYAKRLEGIKAWRQSPLNKLYIAIGQEAISKEGGISAIMKERQAAGQDFLTEDEFNAIMDLNKNLRF